MFTLFLEDPRIIVMEDEWGNSLIWSFIEIYNCGRLGWIFFTIYGADPGEDNYGWLYHAK